MSTSTTIQRIARLDPALESGSRAVTIEQTVTINGVRHKLPVFEAVLEITSDHFRQVDLAFRFPLPGTKTSSADILPHVVASRAGWPWECNGNDGSSEKLPWLALLVIAGETRIPIRSGTLANLFAPEERDVFAYPRVLEAGGHERETDPCRFIDLESKLLRLLPSAAQAGLLCHVQITGSEAGAEEQAVILASHTIGEALRAAGLSDGRAAPLSAYLVGLEKFWKDGKPKCGGAAKVRLPVFGHWTFHYSPLKKDDARFDRIAKRAADKAGLIGPPPGSRSVQPSGHCQLPGKGPPTFYRGPLLPGASAGPGPAMPDQPGIVERSGIRDISLAAASELGRLLTVHDKELAAALYHWRIERRTKNAKTDPPAVIMAHLNGLAKLEGVPMHYLFADAALVPPEESVRFFHLDRVWVAALTAGALAVGRHSKADKDADERVWTKKVLPKIEALDASCITGFLLRSELVRGWPQLQVALEGAKLLRRAPLAPDLLLVLAEGRITAASLKLPKAGTHFARKDATAAAAKDSVEYAERTSRRDGGVRMTLGGTHG